MQDTRFSRQEMLKIIVAFACVYVFWGSAYVAIRYSVQTVHPAFVAGIRYVIAGLILLAFLVLRGYRLSLCRSDLLKVTGLGLLMFTCNTLLLSYSGRILPAGLIALLLSTIPLFITLLQAAWPGRTGPTSLWNWAFVITGFLGVALLVSHSVSRGLLPHNAIYAALGLLTAAFAWGLGSVVLARTSFAAPALVCTCWQMLIGGGVDLLFGLGVGGHRSSQLNVRSWLSLTFLAICGTLMGYTSYSFLLRRFPISSVATYAYVNPLVAVLLGWRLLHEPLAAGQWFGLAVVLASVAMIVSVSSREKDAAPAVLEATSQI